MRGRSYSYSPPARGYGRRGRSPSSPARGYGRRGWRPNPRGRYGSRGSDSPTSFLVWNLHRDCREPHGFGFVRYVDPADAVEAKYQMDGQILLGRELTVVFAEENRKKPAEMRARDSSVSPRDKKSHQEQSYSCSPAGSRSRSRSAADDYPSKPSHREERSYSASLGSRSRSRSPAEDEQGKPSNKERPRSRSPVEDYQRKWSHRERSVSVSG